MPRREFRGVVVSDKCDKTVTVKVDTMVKHPVYKKYIKRSSKFAAHDADNSAKQGDYVTIQECRPLSKSKTWKIVAVEA